MPERINYWGIPHNWGAPELYVYTIMFLAAFVMLFRFYRQVYPQLYLQAYESLNMPQQ